MHYICMYIVHVRVVPWRRVVYGIHKWRCFYRTRGRSLAWVPGLPRSVRVLIMRRRQTFENRGRLSREVARDRPGVDAMQGAMWVESTAIKKLLHNRF